MPIFHLATAADWEAARRTGRYTTSTRGRTLAEEGFVHASRADQWQAVRERYYADVTEPLVLLVIDPDRLAAPVVDESGPDGVETFPHVYGAVDVAAVTRVIPLDPGAATPAPTPALPLETTLAPAGTVPRAPQRSFLSYFLEEMTVRAVGGVVVLVVAVSVGLLAEQVLGPVAALVTILVLLVLGGVVLARFLRRRDGRLRAGTGRADSQA